MSTMATARLPRASTSACWSQALRECPCRLRGFLDPPTEFLDRLVVRKLVDGVDVPVDEVHVRLKDPRQFPGIVRLDQHEPRPTTGKVVPATNLLGVVSARVVLFQHSAAHLGSRRVGLPLEPAVPQHEMPPAKLPSRCDRLRP